MWFVFPQIAGLGESPTARYFAIDDLDEARAHLGHRVLGARLREYASVLTSVPAQDPEALLGAVDAMKLRSSMTLFLPADPTEHRFREVLGRYFGGVPDPATDRLFGSEPPPRRA